MKPLVYVAGPYSGDVEENIARAENISIQLIKMGYHVITPHKNTAGMAKYFRIRDKKKCFVEDDGENCAQITFTVW